MSHNGIWQAALLPKELKLVASHLKQCDKCQKEEVNAILSYAERAAGKTVMKMVDTVDTKTGNNSEEDAANVLPFDKFPTILLEHILQFTKGQLIMFTRDEDGRLERITGKTDGEVESSCIVVRDGSKTSVHCHCHNCEDALDTEFDRLTFADFHIDFPNKNLIVYTLDVAEFLPEDHEIKKCHFNFKLYLNDSGMVIRMQHNKDRLYHAEYDCNHNLIKVLDGKVTTVFDYAGDKKKSMKRTTCEGVESNLSFKYDCKLKAPVKIFCTDQKDPKLIQINKSINPSYKKSFVELIYDGVSRGYFDATGLLNVKVRLPKQENGKEVIYSIDDLKEYCGSLNTIDAVIADQRTRTMRILRKVNGERRLDQTSTFRDGLIVKIYNHKDATFTSVLSSHFSSRHWSDIIEKDDGIL